NETAEEFITRVNKTLKEETPELSSAFWLHATHLHAASQRVASAANERALAMNNSFIEQAKLYDVSLQTPEIARALTLIKVGASMPAPRDPAKLKQLSTIASSMEAAYGAGKWCVDGDCPDIRELRQTL